MAATTITTNKRRHDRSAAPAPEHRYLVCLRNHTQPPVLWLTQEARADKKTALDVVRSDEGDRFTPPGGETVFISGPTKTPGFTLEHAAYRDDVVYGLVRVDVVYGLVRVDARSLLPDGDGGRWIVRDTQMFENFVLGRPLKIAWSELEPAIAVAPGDHRLRLHADAHRQRGRGRRRGPRPQPATSRPSSGSAATRSYPRSTTGST